MLTFCFFYFLSLIGKLEDFCCSGAFTQFISDFGGVHAAKFTYEDEEQSLECYTIYQDFKAQVDQKLEVFMELEESREALG